MIRRLPALLLAGLVGAGCSRADDAGAALAADAPASPGVAVQASPAEAGDAPPRIVREREVVFVHAGDDEIHILDGVDGTLIRALAPGEGGLLRGALRPLEHERRRFDADPTAPYRLVLEGGGRLVLVDPHTGFELDVAAFGSSSRAEFLTLLPPP